MMGPNKRWLRSALLVVLAASSGLFLGSTQSQGSSDDEQLSRLSQSRPKTHLPSSSQILARATKPTMSPLRSTGLRSPTSFLST